jgi:putative ABC transport system permease protein
MKTLRRFLNLFRRRKLDAEMTEEMRLHVEMQTESNLRAGMTPGDAHFAALRQFGNVASAQELCREGRGWTGVEAWIMVFRLALRTLTRSPGFSLAVFATLALCLGPVTAVFSVLHSIVLRSLPFPQADGLVQISNHYEKPQEVKDLVNLAQYLNFKSEAGLFRGFALLQGLNGTVGEESNPARVSVTCVTEDFFSVLGMQPVLGRFFLPGEMAVGADQVFVITQEHWERTYASDPAIIGRKIWMDGVPYTVVGVVQAGFAEYQTTMQIFKPFAWTPAEAAGPGRFLRRGVLLGGLRPGVALSEGLAQLETVDRRLLDAYPPQHRAVFESRGQRIAVDRLHEVHSAPFASSLALLQGGACFVLLIGCVNVVNLFLARVNSRRPELAVRHALGATRSALLRPLLAESLLLAGAAAVAGVGISGATMKLINHYLVLKARWVPPVSTDLPVIGIVLLSSVLIAAGMAVIPFLFVWRSGLTLQTARTASAGGAARAISRALVVAQVAIAFVLLIGAGLLMRSFSRVIATDPGFDAAQVIQGRVALPRLRYQDPAMSAATEQRVVAAMREIPGVEKVATSANFGVDRAFPAGSVRLRNPGAAVTESRGMVSVSVVSPGYFETMGIRVKVGRDFSEHDAPIRGKSPTAVVDESFVKVHFPEGDAVGREFTFDPAGSAQTTWITIVGIVNRANLGGLEGRDGLPFVYLPRNGTGALGFTLLLRTHRPAGDVVSEMRQKVREIDAALPLYSTGTLQEGIDNFLAARRGLMSLLAVFAGLALLLAGVGLYGVLAYDVAQRSREIGIRGALGATRQQIVAPILGQGIVQVLLGLGFGAVGAVYLTRFLRTMLFDVMPDDPLSYGVVVFTLSVVGLLASWLPARRAAKVDPVVALRAE